MNLLENLSRDQLPARSLGWEHAPSEWEALPGGGIRVAVPPMVDYFVDPGGSMTKDDAPYLYLKVKGDFVARAHVRPSFTTTWDAGAIMIRHDSHHWAKLAYESTDMGTTAVVSVVTNGVSDDANGIDLTVADVWLQVFRKGNVFGMHYALDGVAYRMVRVFNLPLPDEIQVGVVAQCPAGPGASVDVLSFSVEGRSVKALRAGV